MQCRPKFEWWQKDKNWVQNWPPKFQKRILMRFLFKERGWVTENSLKNVAIVKQIAFLLLFDLFVNCCPCHVFFVTRPWWVVVFEIFLRSWEEATFGLGSSFRESDTLLGGKSQRANPEFLFQNYPNFSMIAKAFYNPESKIVHNTKNYKKWNIFLFFQSTVHWIPVRLKFFERHLPKSEGNSKIEFETLKIFERIKTTFHGWKNSQIGKNYRLKLSGNSSVSK